MENGLDAAKNSEVVSLTSKMAPVFASFSGLAPVAFQRITKNDN